MDQSLPFGSPDSTTHALRSSIWRELLDAMPIVVLAVAVREAWASRKEPTPAGGLPGDRPS